TLSETPPVDSPGIGGGRLSERLLLRIDDVTDPGSPRQVFFGWLGALPPTALGSAPDGGSRTYEFSVGFPRAPAAGLHAYMAASTSVGFAWDAGASSYVHSASTESPCQAKTGTALA